MAGRILKWQTIVYYLIELVIYNVYWYQYFLGVLLNYTVLTLVYEQKFIFSVEIIDKNKVGGTKFDIFIYTYLCHKSLNYIIECWVYL